MLVSQKHFYEISSKILIVYFSITKNTEKIANKIHEEVGGDLFRIDLINDYPPTYKEQTELAKKELKEGFLPSLKDRINDIEKYDVIYIGSPNWWGTICPPVRSFIHQHNLSGKKIIPFITHGGGGKENTVNDLTKLCDNSIVEQNAWIGFGSNDSGFDDWIKKL